jgi:transcriptional regulator GlxA family with amidase domain
MLAHLAAIAALLAAQPAAPQPGKNHTRTVAVVLYPGVELLDFAGPCEVFHMAGERFRVVTVAHTADPILTHGSVTVTPARTIADCPRADLVIIPGGDAPQLTRDAAMMDWLKTATDGAEVTMSVCTGAFALAQLGELDGQKSTTHWSAITNLRTRYPKTTVVPDSRFVDNGRIVTTAGVSAGIDGALHVVARLAGDDIAWQAARGMEYVWEPPLPDNASDDDVRAHEALREYVFRHWDQAAAAYTSIIAAHPEDRVAQFRLGTCLVNTGKAEEGLAAMQRAVQQGYDEPFVIASLARAQLQAGRHADAIASYERALAAGLSDHGTSWYNLGCAHALSGHTDEAFKALARAIDAGFANRSLMERDEDLNSLRADTRFKALLDKI